MAVSSLHIAEGSVRSPGRGVGRLRWSFSLLILLTMVAGSGCQGSMFQTPQNWAFWKKQEPRIDYTVPEDAIVLQGGQLLPDQGLKTEGGDFEGARRLFQDKKYTEAEPIFTKIAENKKNTMPVLEASRYYQAECLFRRGKYPTAADRYMQLLNDFPTAAHGEESRKRLFDIANYWLDETRDQMEQAKEVREGKRWMATPIMPVHFETSKPLLDIEGHAIRALEAVHMTDPRGPLGEKALFFIGSVKFYREDYRDAEHYFRQLVTNYPNGLHAANAQKLIIVCHELTTPGADYDARRFQEAREQIELAKRSYPELQSQEQWLTQQAVTIHNLEAKHDFNIARFYERTGYPGSAHFYYEIVKRRYPGTPLAQQAEIKLAELRSKAQREEGRQQQSAPQGNQEMAPMPRPIIPGQPVPRLDGNFGTPRTLPPGFGGAG